jgi:hypothetical protein
VAEDDEIEADEDLGSPVRRTVVHDMISVSPGMGWAISAPRTSRSVLSSL